MIDVGSGEEALPLLMGDARIALAVLDLRMPGIGGFAVLEALRAAGTLERLGVVVVSAHAADVPTSRPRRSTTAAMCVRQQAVQASGGAARGSPRCARSQRVAVTSPEPHRPPTDFGVAATVSGFPRTVRRRAPCGRPSPLSCRRCRRSGGASCAG